MHKIALHSLPYSADSTHYFELLQALGLDKPVFLDSAHLKPHDADAQVLQHSAQQHPNSRFDILSAAPQQWLEIPTQAMQESTAAAIEAQITQWFAQFQQHQVDYTTLPKELQKLPFCGGIIANFSYELGQFLNTQTQVQVPHSNSGLFSAGFYPWAIIQDHRLELAHWVHIEACVTPSILKIMHALAQPPAAMSAKPVVATKNSPARQPFTMTQALRATIDKEAYMASFNKIQDYILNGDCYQINFAQHYRGAYSGDPWQAYKQLRKVARAPFSAYWDTGSVHILCASPERFLAMQDQHISTKPIKGTRPRGNTQEEDQALAQALSCSIKDCAENLMIVDLLRNDLGKNCKTNSINVDALFKVESFSTVHHLVSEISGQLNDGCDQLQAFLDCFPGGSITGAPKIRAMQIINELEQQARQIYCGSIAYFSCHQRSDSNICIRTFLCQSDRTILTWAGGGIVADSQPDKEYAECGYKIDKLINALNNNS